MTCKYRLRAMLTAGFLTGHTALAQSLPEGLDISGEWAFSTGSYHNGLCSMAGHMRISPPDTNGRQVCQFTTHENCGENYSAEVRQICVVDRKGKQVTISSTISKIVNMTPAPYGYAPDHWVLTIKSAQEMNGYLVSAHGSSARFTREPLPVS